MSDEYWVYAGRSHWTVRVEQGKKCCTSAEVWRVIVDPPDWLDTYPHVCDHDTEQEARTCAEQHAEQHEADL